MVTIETDEEHAADMLRHRAQQRAMDALASADAALSAERPWRGAADAYEQLAREAREPEPVARPARAAPSRAAPSPPAADDGEAAFDGQAPARMGVVVKLLELLVRDERARAATALGELERRIEALEARASGETKKAKKR